MMRPTLRLLLFAVTTVSASTVAGPLTTSYPGAPYNVLGLTATGEFDPFESYPVAGIEWSVNTVPLEDVLSAGNVSQSEVSFWNVLTNQFPGSSGWTFVVADPLSDGSLRARTYDAEYGNATGISCDTCVGVEFQLQYVAGAGSGRVDPRQDLHWIQVILDNHGSAHGVTDNIVDNGGAAWPYYEGAGVPSDANDFFDFPIRGDANAAHSWLAELFLVTGPPRNRPGQVTLYSGVRYGWTNIREAPAPPTYLLLMVGLATMVMWMKSKRGIPLRGARSDQSNSLTSA